MKKITSPITETTTSTFLSIPVAILIGSLLIAISILLSGGVIRIKGINDQATAALNTPPITTPTDTQVLPEDTGVASVSVDDDPALGNKDAPLTMIEFSDYECPFCKRYFDETYSQIKKDYVDTGKMKIVFRDLPLSFHDPMATKEAIAANCAREQGGDASYFKYHDELFKRTTSNGNGLSLEQLPIIATDLGLDGALLKSCVDADKSKDEVTKDLNDASAAGATGTPSFFIGKSTDNGTIEGSKLVGAQPYSAFKQLIDSQL